MKTKLELLSGGNLNPVYLFMDSQNYKKFKKKTLQRENAKRTKISIK